MKPYRPPMKVTAMLVHEPDAERIQSILFAPVAFVLFLLAVAAVTCVCLLLLAALYFAL